MKTVQTVFALLLLAAITAVAQTPCAPHPTDAAAILIGQFTTTIEIAQAGSVTGKTGKKGTKCTSEQLICVWRTSNGGTDLIGDPATVKLSGSCLTDIPPGQLLALLGRSAVAKAITLGFVKTSTTNDGKTVARYLTTTCVSKSGSGTTMRLTPCTDVPCVRAYSAFRSGTSSTPTIERTPADNQGCVTTPPGCQTGCDQDCPPSDGSLVQ